MAWALSLKLREEVFQEAKGGKRQLALACQLLVNNILYSCCR
jgi:hypothetical protein